jgi:hypothetical protein
MRTPRGARAALADWQTGLLTELDAESGWRARQPGTRQALRTVRGSRGLRFTRDVRRSWCAWRAARSAPLTLAVLPVSWRARLLKTWLARGGGSGSFASLERAAFLRFLSGALVGHPAARAVCRFERALHELAAVPWKPGLPDGLEPAPTLVLRRARGAALIDFPGRVYPLLAAAAQGLPLHQATHLEREPRESVLVAPGLTGGWRVATPAQVRLWRAASRGLDPVQAQRLYGGACVATLLEARALVACARATSQARLQVSARSENR